MEQMRLFRVGMRERLRKPTLLANGMVAALSLCALAGGSSALAQNAAQRAALAQLGRGHANAVPYGGGSGVEAISVPLDQPGGVAFDATGDLYIADTGNHVVREVNLLGVITTVAGTGGQGFSGDGGAATSALLDSPAGVAVDSTGNIYIADTNNNRIREVSGGVIATIAGTGAAGFAGDGGAATSAQLDHPLGVAVDSNGNVYIADTGNSRIREIAGGSIATVAGNGQQIFSGDGGPATAAGIDSPGGVAVDAAFNFYFGDTNNQRVRMVTFSTGIISTLAGTGVNGFNGDGAATLSELSSPRGVAVGAPGTIYVADTGNDRIRSIGSGHLTTVAGTGAQGFTGDNGSSASASLDSPRGVASAGTTVAFADTGNDRVRAVNSQVVDTVAGLAPPHTESLSISGSLSVVYGTGTLTATFSNGSNTASGSVKFYDGEDSNPALVGTVPLTANAATISTSLFSAGTHYIVASYAGDANNPATTSGVFIYVVTPVQLTAVASSYSILYGQAVPTLSGTLTGVLAQDSGNVTANFSSAATMTAAPGSYPIAVTLTGSAAGNYTVVLGSGSGSVTISQAPTKATIASSSLTPIFGTPLTLTATIASTTSGTPGGTVNFYEGSTLLNSTPVAVSGGQASFAISTLLVGSQTIYAVYSGNVDFIGSTSSTISEDVLSPDFSITSSPSTQAVLPSQSVNYTITLTPVNPTFVYPLTLSATGLPSGVTATFTPASIATGAGVSTSVLTLAANGQAGVQKGSKPFAGMASSTALALLLLPLFFGRRGRKAAARFSRSARMLLALLALAAVGAVTSCGGGGFFSHSVESYTVTVTAVSGPDTHTTTVTLTVQ